MHVFTQLLPLETLLGPPPPAAQQGSLLQTDQGVHPPPAKGAQSGEWVTAEGAQSGDWVTAEGAQSGEGVTAKGAQSGEGVTG